MKTPITTIFAPFLLSLFLFHQAAAADVDKAAQPAAAAVEFGPSGIQRDVRQIRLYFNRDMAAVGDNSAPDAAKVNCSGTDEKPEGRWLDGRRWTADFQSALPDGVACTVQPQPIKTLDGETVSMPAPWGFTTGGPQLAETLPRGELVQENPVTAFRPSATVDPTTLKYLECTVNGKGMPVHIMEEAEKHDELAKLQRQYSYWKKASDGPDDKQWVVARCGSKPWPADAAIVWRWGKEIASPNGVVSVADTLHKMRVRRAFSIDGQCRRLAGSEDCDPRRPVSLKFSEDVPAAEAAKIVLHGSSGKTYRGKVPTRYWNKNFADEMTFEDAFEEGETLRFEWPADLRDKDDRRLTNTGTLKMPFRMARLPAYVGVMKSDGVVAGPQGKSLTWPVAVRNSDAVTIRRWNISGRDGSSEALIALHAFAENRKDERVYGEIELLLPKGVTESDLTRPFVLSEALMKSLASGVPAQEDQVVVPSQSGLEFIDAQIPRRGTWIIEADSAAYRKAFAAQMAEANDAALEAQARNRVAIVQDTNLNINARMSRRGNSLVWLTTFDTGRPVANASIEVWSCDRELLSRQRTDEQGRVMMALGEESGECAWIIARLDDDVAVLHATKQGYHHRNDGAFGHTILDRDLFHAGETVHMQHLARRLGPNGWTIAPAGKGELSIDYYGARRDDVVYEQKLDWKSDGSATSEWKIPPSARLGTYFYEVKDSEGHTIDEGLFQVEEFRTPVFDAKLENASGWKDGKPYLRLRPSLAFMAGGAAAGYQVRLKGRYSYRDSFIGEDGYRFTDETLDVPDDTEMQEIPLTLDRNGRADQEIALPAIVQPTMLRAEMQFADPDGETQAETAAFMLWPTRYKTGLRVELSARPDTLKISAISLDENNQPLKDRTVTVETQEAANDSAGWKDEAKSARVCAIRTDEHGKGSCEIPWKKESASGIWLFRARADEAMTAVTREYDKFLTPEKKIPILERVRQDLPAVGSSDRLRVRAPFLPATLLLTVERDGVFDSQVHYLARAEEEIDVPIRANYAPAVTIGARFVRGLQQGGADSKETYLDVQTDTAINRLSVGLKPARPTVRPGSKLPVRISVVHEASGKPAPGARVTLIALDDALLALHPNQTWSVLDEFFWRSFAFSRNYENTVSSVSIGWPFFSLMPAGQTLQYIPDEERAVYFWHGLWTRPSAAEIEDRNISPVVVTGIRASMRLRQAIDEKWRESRVETVTAEDVGKMPDKNVANTLQRLPGVAISQSAAGSGGFDNQRRENFSSLALWRTDVTLDTRGEAVVKVPFPDSLTQWRIVAIAVEGSDRYGTGQTTVKTDQPLQIISGFPQTVRSGDTLRQKLTLRNRSARSITVQLNALAKVEAKEELPAPYARVPAGSKEARGLTLSRKLKLAPGENRVVEWPVSIPEGIARLGWAIDAKAADSDAGDRLDIVQAVVPAQPVTVRESLLVQVDRQRSLALALPAGTRYGAVAVQWAAGLTEGPLQSAREWMRLYPYSCLEQQSSKAAVSGDPAQWRAVVEALPRYVKQDGLVSYFPDTQGSEILTTYLLDLTSAYGLPLPEKEKSGMKQGLRDALAKAGDLSDGAVLEQRLAMQAAIAPDLGEVKPIVPVDLNRLSTGSLIDWVRYLLAVPGSAERDTRLAQAAGQLRNRYDIHGARLTWRNDGRDDQWWFMRNRETAIARTILLAQQWSVMDSRWKDDLPLLVSALVDEQRRGSWGTTTANAWSVAALEQFTKSAEHGAVGGVSKASFGGHVVSRTWPDPDTAQLPWTAQASRGALALSHEGSGTPWATVQILAAAKTGVPETHGLSVHKTLTPVVQRSTGRWSEGDIVKVTLDMDSASDLGWVVVRDPIPSGATILGKSLGREDMAAEDEARIDWRQHPDVEERANDSYRGYYERIWRGAWKATYLVRLNNAGRFDFPPTRIEAMYSPDIFGESPNPVLEVGP